MGSNYNFKPIKIDIPKIPEYKPIKIDIPKYKPIKIDIPKLDPQIEKDFLNAKNIGKKIEIEQSSFNAKWSGIIDNSLKQSRQLIKTQQHTSNKQYGYDIYTKNGFGKLINIVKKIKGIQDGFNDRLIKNGAKNLQTEQHIRQDGNTTIDKTYTDKDGFHNHTQVIYDRDGKEISKVTNHRGNTLSGTAHYGRQAKNNYFKTDKNGFFGGITGNEAKNIMTCNPNSNLPNTDIYEARQKNLVLRIIKALIC